MKCNNCEAELEEGVTLCPECGCENAPAEEIAPEMVEQIPTEEIPVEEVSLEEAPVEETSTEETSAEEASVEEVPAREPTPIVEGKLTPGKIALLVVLAVTAIVVVIALIVGGMGGAETGETTAALTQEAQTAPATEGTDAAEATDATDSAMVEQAAEGTIPADGNPDDATCKGSYTVSDDEAAAAVDTVVATLGEAELTNSELQAHYWMQVSNFINNYGMYASYFGLDYTLPLDQQVALDGMQTWQQYFLNAAINSWHSYKAMAMQAEKEGFSLEEDYPEEAEFLASMPKSMETDAANNGFESVEEMVAARFGAGLTSEGYVQYMTDAITASCYYQDLLNEIEITDADVDAYFEENLDHYTESGITKESEDAYIDVRHILVMPKGGITDETGVTTYSEDEWEACRVAAQDIYDQWLAGEATEDTFAELAMAYSEDGNYAEGGLYEGVGEGEMVPTFNDWCFDQNRKYGDHDLVQTEYGYHVMFFVGRVPAWYATAKNELRSERENAIIEDAMAAYTLDVDYSSIVLGYVNLAES